MEIKIEDLRIGDEVLLCGQTTKYLKILELPRVGKPRSWNPTVTIYKAIKCHVNMDLVPYQKTVWKLSPNGNIHTTVKSTVLAYNKIYNLIPPLPESPKLRFSFDGLKIWLVNRSTI